MQTSLCQLKRDVSLWKGLRCPQYMQRSGWQTMAIPYGLKVFYDDVIKWKLFPCYWPFVCVIHRSQVNSPHKGQWRGALMFSLICAQINGWINNDEAGDLRRHRAHYNVIVMFFRSVHFPVFQSHRNTRYLLNITFTFDRCRSSWAVVAPVKCECVSSSQIGICLAHIIQIYNQRSLVWAINISHGQ